MGQIDRQTDKVWRSHSLWWKSGKPFTFDDGGIGIVYCILLIETCSVLKWYIMNTSNSNL